MHQKLSLKQKTFIALFLVGFAWVFRYESLGHGYMHDRWTNTTITIDELERQGFSLWQLYEDWAYNVELRRKVIIYENELAELKEQNEKLKADYMQVAKQRSDYSRELYYTRNPPVPGRCDAKALSSNNPLTQMHCTGELEKLIEEKKKDNSKS